MSGERATVTWGASPGHPTVTGQVRPMAPAVWGPPPADRLAVLGGRRLHGAVRVGGAKNSALKLMAAALLAEGVHELTNVPRITDVATMAELLGALGVRVDLLEDPAGAPAPGAGVGAVRVHRPHRILAECPAHLVEQMRASIVVLGPLLAVCGRAVLASPGGDDFGHRPIDMHLRGLEAMGARISAGPDALVAETPDGLRGAEVRFDFPSVGATENVLMAAVCAVGTTVIDNAAREPEIVDLCRFLQAMGADIHGVGTPTLVVHGVRPADLRAVTHAVVPDRIEAATFICALGAVGGEMDLLGARPDHMVNVLRKVRAAGLRIVEDGDRLVVEATRRPRATDVATLPYPGVATDVKPMLTAMLSVADGTSIVTENLFSGRFRYVEELVRLGADITTDAHHAVIRGVPRLHGAPTRAHDIRAGAALVVAALAADGDTTIGELHHLDRGYPDLAGKLRGLGACVERVG
jgi:UDP-N-acetylglucosamine 1-carboxyvinyltransferase